jgi:hypothetical protein
MARMRVAVQLCCGPTGERLKRTQWVSVGTGWLSIAPGTGRMAGALVASVEGRDDPADRHLRQLARPLGDVRVMTYSGGLLVIGLQISAQDAGTVVREFRQAWYCVPRA